MTVGVIRHTLPFPVEAEAAFLALAPHLDPLLWCESRGDRGTGRSVLATGREVSLLSGFELDQLRDEWTALRSRLTADVPSDCPLGLVGWLAFDVARETLGVGAVTTSPVGAPSTSRFVAVDRCLEIQQDTGVATLWALGEEDSEDLAEWTEWMSRLLHGASTTTPPPLPGRAEVTSPAIWRDDPENYRRLIERAREHIREGDAYQLCLTTEVTVAQSVDPRDLYRRLRREQPTPYQALLQVNGISVVASSPELFLRLDGEGRVSTKPIKGTRPRGQTPADDALLRDHLLSSDKERAENVMIVDLMRNDLGRVCEADSIQVPVLLDVESYPSVHQLVSTVSGVLRPGVDGIDLIRATFPAGSMTGAPKHRAVTILAELESGERGIYSGCFGFLYLDGGVELAMTIRTAIVSDDGVRIGVGGGITWSSEADQEIAEVGHKARGILRCLGVSVIQYS